MCSTPLDIVLFYQNQPCCFLWEFLVWRHIFEAPKRWCSHILLSLWTRSEMLVGAVSLWLFNPWVLVRTLKDELRSWSDEVEKKCSASHLDPRSLCSGCQWGFLGLSPSLCLWQWVSDKGWVEETRQRRTGKTSRDLGGNDEGVQRCRERRTRPA